MKLVVLIRGLSTSGADDIRIGPLTLGSFYRGWEKALRQRKISYTLLDDLGTGTLRDSYPVALELLKRKLAQRPEAQFHILTHSSGGLLGRRLTYEPQLRGRILSLATIACPHGGSQLVPRAEKWSKNPALRFIFRRLNYDLEERLDHLRELDAAKLLEFNKFYPPLKGLKQVNIPCSPGAAERAWVFKLLSLGAGELGPSPGDGLLSLREQEWAGVEVWGPAKLDHLSSLGVFLHLQGSRRAYAQREFDRLVDHLSSLWQTF